jgi:hypothetical protein
MRGARVHRGDMSRGEQVHIRGALHTMYRRVINEFNEKNNKTLRPLHAARKRKRILHTFVHACAELSLGRVRLILYVNRSKVVR